MAEKLYGGIEAGGSKFVCAVGTAEGRIIDSTKILTTSPTETLQQVAEYFAGQPELTAIGIGTFGPVDLDKNSPQYGYLTTPPKPGWQSIDIVGQLADKIDAPIHLRTDVEAAGLAESQLGAGKGKQSLVYLTIGTGIGGAYIQNARISDTPTHAEMGHQWIGRVVGDDFQGVCRYHADCWEGMASAMAMTQRWGKAPRDVDASNAWDLEAHYLARGIHNIILTLTPDLIILGGGVVQRQGLIEMVRMQVDQLIAGYIQLPDLESYITLPQLDQNAGVTGALLLAAQNQP